MLKLLALLLTLLGPNPSADRGTAFMCVPAEEVATGLYPHALLWQGDHDCDPETKALELPLLRAR